MAKMLVKKENKLADIVTMIDLGAMDHYFTNIDIFNEYEKFDIPLTEKTAERGTSFIIMEQDTVKITIEIKDGKIIDFILRDMLHTPGLHLNLISILKIAILEVYHNKLYLVKVICKPLVLNTRSVRKAISLEN